MCRVVMKDKQCLGDFNAFVNQYIKTQYKSDVSRKLTAASISLDAINALDSQDSSTFSRILSGSVRSSRRRKNRPIVDNN